MANVHLRKMISWQWLAGLLGVLIFLAAWAFVINETAGLTIVKVHPENSSPVVFIGPSDMLEGTRPLVLIGHGFAGSAVLMRSFAIPLARAGFVTALWDFNGHGYSPNPMTLNGMPLDLNVNVELVFAEAQRLGVFSPGQVAILGHSMGSGVALRYGKTHPETRSTIAVSPVSVSVSPDLPQNLLLMAGEYEQSFVKNAGVILAEAGGSGGDFATGTARRFVMIPGVEHITILFSNQAHLEAIKWLESVFGVQKGAERRPARLMYGYVLGLVGALMASAFLIPATQVSSRRNNRSFWQRSLGLLCGALSASLLLSLLDNFGVELTGLFGIQVGGFLMLWFGVAGVVALILLGIGEKGPAMKNWPDARSVVMGLAVFVVLWIGVGLIGAQTWLPWFLSWSRLIMWPLAALMILPWFLAVGEANNANQFLSRAGWWLWSSIAVIAGTFLSLRLTPNLGFLVIILPLFPFILVFHALAAGRQYDRWAFGISGALYVSWVILTVFPLR